MKCPLCAHEGIDVKANVCPSCNADLTVYKNLNSIQRSLSRQRMISIIFIILFILAIAACTLIFFTRSAADCTDTEQKLQQCEQQKTEHMAKIDQLNRELSSLQEENKRLQEVKAAPAKPENITHVVKEGETLYSIALRYLGDGKLFTMIANENGIKDPDWILAGSTIIIQPK